MYRRYHNIFECTPISFHVLSSKNQYGSASFKRCNFEYIEVFTDLTFINIEFIIINNNGIIGFLFCPKSRRLHSSCNCMHGCLLNSEDAIYLLLCLSFPEKLHHLFFSAVISIRMIYCVAFGCNANSSKKRVTCSSFKFV